MPESQVRALEVDERAGRRAIIAACCGNVFEWYDFTVYALFALSIAKAFFPGSDPTIELVKAFLAFGLGFVVRPLGAVLLGIYGDRSGRKAVLTATIGLMAVGTLIIAVSPMRPSGSARPCCCSRAGCCRASRPAARSGGRRRS
jgi:MFS transporter, MHS family, proline/betaine transporter